VVKSIVNAATDSETNLYEAVRDYIRDDKIESEIQKNKELTEKLNGLTNEDAQGVEDTLQKTADIASKGGGFSGNVEIYNDEIENKGYAYQDNDENNKTIGISTKKNDLTDSGGVINTLFHETTDFEAHKQNEQTAINRGNTAEAIWGLKNFGNANTNKMTNEQWNENNAGSAVFQTGNANVRTNIANSYNNKGQIAGFAGIDDVTLAVGAGALIIGMAAWQAAQEGDVSVSAIGANISNSMSAIGDTLFGKDRESFQEKADVLQEMAGGTAMPPNPFDPNEDKNAKNDNNEKEQDINKETTQNNGNNNFVQNLRDKLGSRDVNINDIKANPADDFSNPKIGASDTQYRYHVDYIRRTGKIEEPITVKRLPNGSYEIVDGHHRWLAARNSGLKNIPVKVVK
jgi:hypothetical protein